MSSEASMDFLDSYDISKKIIDLWQQNQDKSSGQIQKGNMTTPIFVQNNDAYIMVTGVVYVDGVGIVITTN
jgi:hypothetical protein